LLRAKNQGKTKSYGLKTKVTLVLPLIGMAFRACMYVLIENDGGLSMIRLFFRTGTENCPVAFPSFFLFSSSHRAPPGSTPQPQRAWVAYLAGEHASPTSAFGLVGNGNVGDFRTAVVVEKF
jgi:hypothetical protein